MAMNVSTFQEQMSELVTALQEGDDRARESLIASCFSLIQDLETPSETFTRLFWTNLSTITAIKTAVEIDLFTFLKEEERNSSDLAEATSSDQALMLRILRVLAAVGMVNEVGNDAWKATKLSESMKQQIFIDSVRFCVDNHLPGHARTAEFLRKRQYRNPSDMLETPLTEAYGVQGNENAFQIWQKQGRLHELSSMMKVWGQDRTQWCDEKRGFYPINNRLIDGARQGDEEIFLVDIGGGQGFDVSKLLELHPSLPGHVVLQDLPNVIDSIESGSLPETVRLMPHDFWNPQPLKGARTYFMHQVMHDWAPQQAKIILKNIAVAMEKGYSKLIIWDQVVPDVGCPAIYAGLDWLMMTLLAGQERTESTWKALIEDEGIQPRLKVIRFWHYSRNDQNVVEVELA